MSVQIICGEARAVLAGMAAHSVHCVVTSPPYWHQRDYGCRGQIGLESAPGDYIAALRDVFSAVHRVLRDDGTCWIVIGDSYAGSWGNQGRKEERGTQRTINGPMRQQCDGRYPAQGHTTGVVPAGLKPKDLMMIPHRLAIALQDAGWYVRNDCVWAKGSAMPESVQDRFSRAHEYVFHLAKSERYYFDALAVSERASTVDHYQRYHTHLRGVAYADKNQEHAFHGDGRGHGGLHNGRPERPPRRNRRSVLHINPQPFRAADYGVKDIDHYAVCPEKLVEICVLASTSEAGCCAQCGAPWRRVVDHRGGTWPDRKEAGAPLRYGLGSSKDTPRNRMGEASTTTTGWQAGCSCDAGPPRACTTLDPFVGSGTVALVSKRLGRSCVGIDLHPGYCDLARRRVGSVPYPLFSAAGTSEGAAR